MVEMKKCGFIKNKVVEHIMKANVEKATLISHINVTHGIDDSNEIGHAWMVRSQQHSNMTYKVPLPFTRYACCTCEWKFVEICVNIKLSLFLHVLISLKKISFNIVEHGMDMIVEVLPPCLWTLPIYPFMIMNLMMKRLMKIF